MRQKNRKKSSRETDLTHSQSNGRRSRPNPHRPASSQKQASQPLESLPETARAARSGLLLYGFHSVMAALANPNRRCHHLFLSRQAAEQLRDQPPPIATKLASIPQTILERQLLDMLLMRAKKPNSGKNQSAKSASNGSFDNPVHQGFVLHCAPLETSYLEEWLLGVGECPSSLRVLILDQVTDPRNIGAMMRSALAFGAHALLMTDRHAPEESGALAKSAAGALEKLALIRVTNLARTLETLKTADFTLIGLEARANTSLETFASEKRLGLVLGSEGAGMRRLTREGCDNLAAIPISEESESLNVSVAAAIALYATRPPL